MPADGGTAGDAPEQQQCPDLEMADEGGCKLTAPKPVGADAEASTADPLSEGSPTAGSTGSTQSTDAPPSTESMDFTAEPPRPLKESVIVQALRHLDAFEVFSKGRFSHWAPVTMPGLCGHPGPSGKLCNNNAGDCQTHLRREQQLMASEDRLSGIAERGFCGVPLRDGKRCEEVKGKCATHSEAWHLQREFAAMKSEDDASCVADKGICGVMPRAGGAPCAKPKGRCPIHAEGEERCRSALDDDPCAQCRNYRRGGSDFCEFHQDRPNLNLALREFFADRMGELVTEDALRAWDKSRFRDAARALDIYDFSRYITRAAKSCGFAIDCQTGKVGKLP